MRIASFVIHVKLSYPTNYQIQMAVHRQLRIDIEHAFVIHVKLSYPTNYQLALQLIIDRDLFMKCILNTDIKII